MKISGGILQNCTVSYVFPGEIPMEQILFLDIETTGFSPRTSRLYLIGCVYYGDGNWNTRQWFAQKEDEEGELITSFFHFAKDFKLLVHFNGNAFDLPFILGRSSANHLPFTFDAFQGIDLYKRVLPYKTILHLPNCKQKTIERFLGLNREDLLDGGELVRIYQDYLKNPSDPAEHLILLHNSDDLRGMLLLLPILSYAELFTGKVTVKKVQANYYKDLAGLRHQELLMTLALPLTLPRPFSTAANDCYFSGEGAVGKLRVPIYQEELKYFYSNYKDYYYLPSEDMAIHKSVASFVDKEYRTQATAATCYTRKASNYLPQFGLLFEPFYKRAYKDPALFFELTDSMKKDRDAFTTYARHIMEMLGSQV